MRFLLPLFLLYASLFGAHIHIAAASNLGYAMQALKRAFSARHNDIDVTVTFSSSGKLSAQILRGAPYGLFLSADTAYAQKLYDARRACGEPIVYTRGKLVLFSTQPRDFSKKMRLLLAPSVKRIAVANPKTAPYGKAAFEAMRNGGILPKVRSKLIYGESLSQCVTYALKAADIGFISKSSLYGESMRRFKSGVNYIDIDERLYSPIAQAMVLLRNDAPYRKFYDFMLSSQAQTILSHYGYAHR